MVAHYLSCDDSEPPVDSCRSNNPSLFCFIINPLSLDHEFFCPRSLAEASPSSPSCTTWFHSSFHSLLHSIIWKSAEVTYMPSLSAGSWSFKPPSDRSEITNIEALDLPRSARSKPSVDEPEGSNERPSAVAKYSRAMALMECYSKSMSINGGFLMRMTSQKDDPGPKWKTVSIFDIPMAN